MATKEPYIFTIHNRAKDITLDFEACTVLGAVQSMGWDILHCTIVDLHCAKCNDTGSLNPGIGYCKCEHGEMFKIKQRAQEVRLHE